MYQIEKIDAFSLVVKTLESGDEKKANRMMQIIVKSIRQGQKSKRNSQHIIIQEDKDAQLFSEYLIDSAE